jgi:hypothetical protein
MVMVKLSATATESLLSRPQVPVCISWSGKQANLDVEFIPTILNNEPS